jgi:hypothetical protein
MPEESRTSDMLAAYRRAIEAFARDEIGGAMWMFRPDGVLDMSPLGIGVFEGREAARGCWEDVRSSYEDFEQVIEEMRDLGNGVGFGVVASRGRLPGSAGWVELRYANVWIWREGLTERITYYTDINDARATAERLAEERG